MKMRTCDSCRFMEGRQWGEIPANGEIPAIKVRQGFCHALPPRAIDQTSSTFPITNLMFRCGLHSFGWAGFWRAVKRLWTRET